ncbi:hypothetical protein DFP72DRAFT_1067407 [Ephemerocybe angulata]|uniref:Uncharacterized protein n=1 Tax=Ephemerocybe angulata TaxID=980116 RepID=A0A8H6M841_9AGAR|nr:hypothetical protein DFP72DRAFT_1067407 [Tulosesus angulatus]
MPSHRRISAGRRQRMRINKLLLGLSGSVPLSGPGVLRVPSSPAISRSINSESSNSTTVSPRAISRTRPVAGRTPRAQPVVSSPSLQLNTPALSARMDTPTPSLRMDTRTPSFRTDTPTPSLRMDTPTPSFRMETSTPSIEVDHERDSGDDDRMETPTPSFRMETPTLSIEVDNERNSGDGDDTLSCISMDTVVPARRTEVDIEALRESVQHLREAVRVLSVMIEGASSSLTCA